MAEGEGAVSNEEANTHAIKQLYDECLNGKNFFSAGTLISSSFQAPGGTGPAGFLNTIRPLHAAFDPIVFEIEDIVAQYDRVVVRWTMRGRHVGSWAGEGPTGNAVHQAGIVIYKLSGGKVVAFWPMVDRLGLALQLGLVGQPGYLQSSPHAGSQ